MERGEGGSPAFIDDEGGAARHRLGMEVAAPGVLAGLDRRWRFGGRRRLAATRGQRVGAASCGGGESSGRRQETAGGGGKAAAAAKMAAAALASGVPRCAPGCGDGGAVVAWQRRVERAAQEGGGGAHGGNDGGSGAHGERGETVTDTVSASRVSASTVSTSCVSSGPASMEEGQGHTR
uniref:DUF834 domain-containing protein n=1 Tax=Oryza punctata TaxID=4537 RepID=A0A0E0KP80_ORYPU